LAKSLKSKPVWSISNHPIVSKYHYHELFPPLVKTQKISSGIKLMHAYYERLAYLILHFSMHTPTVRSEPNCLVLTLLLLVYLKLPEQIGEHVILKDFYPYSGSITMITTIPHMITLNLIHSFIACVCVFPYKSTLCISFLSDRISFFAKPRRG
jgi:hypothetical protein